MSDGEEVSIPLESCTVGVRVERMASPVSGSTKVDCGSCEEEMWISPATWDAIERGAYPDRFRCVTCVKGGS